jgi:hypothetical protein
MRKFENLKMSLKHIFLSFSNHQIFRLSNLAIALILVSGLNAQTVLSNKVVQKDWRSFIPKGYDTLVTEKGDLNKDAVDDLVLVLKHSDEEKQNIDSINPRLLLILFKQQNGYVFGGSSKTAILCHECGGIYGDPFMNVNITKGVLKIYHYGGSSWRWGYTHKYRYDKNAFYLIGKTESSMHILEFCDKIEEFGSSEKIDINFLTGEFEKKTVTEDCKRKIIKGKKKSTTSYYA